MAKNYTILIGTVGQDLNASSDGGESWTHVGRLEPKKTIPDEGNVRALCVYPDNPRGVLAGSDVGVFRSEDGGATWENLDAPTSNLEVWSVTVDPTDPDTLFVGTRPEGFRISPSSMKQTPGPTAAAWSSKRITPMSCSSATATLFPVQPVPCSAPRMVAKAGNRCLCRKSPTPISMGSPLTRSGPT